MIIKLRKFIFIAFLIIGGISWIYQTIEEGGVYTSNPTGEVNIVIDSKKSYCEQSAERFRTKIFFFKVTEKKMKGRYYYFSGFDKLGQKQEVAELAIEFGRQFENTNLDDFIYKEQGKTSFNIMKPNGSLIIIPWTCGGDKIID